MIKTTEQDFLLAVRKASFVTPESVGVFAKIGEAYAHGLDGAQIDQRLIDSTMVRTVIEGTLRGTDISVKHEAVAFRDYPVTLLTVTLKNVGAQAFAPESLNIFCREFCGDDPRLVDAEGTGVEVPEEESGSFEQKRYFIAFDDCTVMLESELPKRFHAEPCGVTAVIGKDAVCLAPGEEVTLPAITIAVSEGDVSRCESIYRAWSEVHL